MKQFCCKTLNGKTEEAKKILKDAGFKPQSITKGGYEQWRHPDGSRIWIRPDGEVIRLGPKTVSPEGNSFRPRFNPDGSPSSTHNTGERIIK